MPRRGFLLASAFLAALLVCAAQARGGEPTWAERLAAAAEHADGIRVRTGGQCHRSPLEEDTLFESRDREAIRSFVAAVAVDEAASKGSWCMCCGEPTIELLRGDEIAESLSMHHGQKIRWWGMGGDGRLTPDSADAVCAWLTARGAQVESPRTVAAREAAEAKARDAAQDALLGGAERGAALRASPDAATFARVFREVAPEADARILLLLRLAHPDPNPRDTPGAAVAESAADLLRTEEAPRVAAALRAALTDPSAPPDLHAGAAASVDDLSGRDLPIAAALPALRVPAARAFLARGTPRSRELAVRMLLDDETPEGAALAMTVLPAFDAEGRPASRPTREQMEHALEIVRFCAEADLPRLRALAAASRDPARWGEWIDEGIAARRKREAREAARKAAE